LLTAGAVDEVLVNEDIVEVGAADKQALITALQQLTGYTNYKTEGNTVQLFYKMGTAPLEAINQFCFSQNITLNHLQLKKKSLEAKFFELTNN